MPKEKQERLLCMEDLRHAEYYEMQTVFDTLYAQSKNNEKFVNLMDVILSRENILLAYRNIKANSGSNTPGTDKQTIKDIGRIPPDEMVERVRFIVAGSQHGYRPKPVRRKDIPKPNGSFRPLGIPCIWDRLVQQCIKQVMEPICEAKFSNNSYGFRPARSVEHAISATYRLMQQSHLHYVIEFDIKGFFDNVDHSKLIKQVWSMGIHDKHLLFILKRILKAPIKMPDGSIMHPEKGTPQGGIISPLLANIVLNELDHWIESQWQNNPVTRKYSRKINSNGSEDLSHGYRAMRNTGLKEMYIVRYADDFRILCRTRNDAQNTMYATMQWLSERLHLETSPEKTRIVNVKRHNSEFLGFQMKVHSKAGKDVVKSHMSEKALQKQRKVLIKQAGNIARPRANREEISEIRLYNSMVMGVQNYYRIATHVNLDCAILNRAVMTVLTNSLGTVQGGRLVRKGRPLTPIEEKLYGSSAMLRFVAGSQEPIYPVGYVRHSYPVAKRRAVNPYTPEGRTMIHNNLRINNRLMGALMKQLLHGRSTEYADNRISLFSAQWGKCAVTGTDFISLEDIHCHHKKPRSLGGSDKYENLVLVSKTVHRLIHATSPEIISKYLSMLQLSKAEMRKLNKLRISAGCEAL